MPPIQEQQLIHKLRESSSTYAVNALNNPSQKDSFEYGFHAGYIKGLAKAEALILELLNGEEKDAKATQRQRPRNGYTA